MEILKNADGNHFKNLNPPFLLFLKLVKENTCDPTIV
jgi:hypothetical protein